MTTDLPAPRIVVSPETLRLLTVRLDALVEAWRRFADAVCELMAARFAELTRVLNDAAYVAEAVTPVGRRPAWQSPYGPAHQKRARR